MTDFRARSSLYPMLAMAAAACLVCALAACSSPVRVDSQAVPGTDWSLYSSYAWITEDLMSVGDPESQQYIDAVDDGRIRTAVEAVLAEQGFRKLGQNDADLLLGFGVMREQKFVRSVDPGSSTYRQDASGRAVWAGTVDDIRHFIEGTLTLHFFDRRTEQAVWTGWGSTRLTNAPEPPERLKAAVEQILSQYPPPA